MSELSITIIDASTNEVIERKLTEDELADFTQTVSELQAASQEIQDKASARTSALAKLAALGLTEEEIAAL